MLEQVGADSLKKPHHVRLPYDLTRLYSKSLHKVVLHSVGFDIRCFYFSDNNVDFRYFQSFA